MVNAFERMDHDEVPQDDRRLKGELAEAIVRGEEGDWTSTVQAEQQVTTLTEEERGTDTLEAVGGPETAEERLRGAQHEENFVDPDETGHTLYDVQQEDAQEVGQTDPAAEGTGTPTAEEIEAAFQALAEQEHKLRFLERDQMGVKFDERAPGGNSKPIAKDYRVGDERIAA